MTFRAHMTPPLGAAGISVPTTEVSYRGVDFQPTNIITNSELLLAL